MSISEAWEKIEEGLAHMCHQFDLELRMVPMGDTCIVSLTEEDNEDDEAEYTLKWGDDDLMEIHGMYERVIKVTAIPAAIFGIFYAGHP